MISEKVGPKYTAEFKPTGVFVDMGKEPTRFRYSWLAAPILGIAAAVSGYHHVDGKITPGADKTEYTRLGGLFDFYSRLTINDNGSSSVTYNDFPFGLVVATDSNGDGSIDSHVRKLLWGAPLNTLTREDRLYNGSSFLLAESRLKKMKEAYTAAK